MLRDWGCGTAFGLRAQGVSVQRFGPGAVVVSHFCPQGSGFGLWGL